MHPAVALLTDLFPTLQSDVLEAKQSGERAVQEAQEGLRARLIAIEAVPTPCHDQGLIGLTQWSPAIRVIPNGRDE